MGITTTRTGTPAKFDAAKAAKLIAAFVPGAILRRTDKGISSTGAAFAPYSSSYRKTLAAMGEDQKIDLRVTGGLMGSIKARDIVVTPDGVSVTVAPDPGTSPAVHANDGKAKRSGRRGPQHNVLGYWIHNGTATMTARPFLALTAEQARELFQMLVKAKLLG
jgi:hypothetical protein